MSDAKLFRVDGLVGVITGAGSGIGRMMAHALASKGANKVYILGRREDKLKETAAGFDNIVPIPADVTDKDALQAAVDRIKSEIGFINVLIVNSGATGPVQAFPQSGSITDLQQILWKSTTDDFNSTFNLNITAASFTLAAFLGLLHAGNEKQNQPGIQSSVIFNASIAGYARSISLGVPYMASKAATLQMAKIYSTVLAKYDIRVNAIAPGPYPSEATAGMLKNPMLLQSIPAHRYGTEEDMHGLILFLTSRAGAFINGNVLISDGGRLSQMPASY